MQQVAAARQADFDFSCLRMPADVRQRLLQDAVERQRIVVPGVDIRIDVTAYSDPGAGGETVDEFPGGGGQSEQVEGRGAQLVDDAALECHRPVEHIGQSRALVEQRRVCRHAS